MVFVKKYIYLSVGVVIVLVIGAILLQNNRGGASVSFSTPNEANLKLQNKETLVKLFKDNNIIDGNNVSQVEINIVDSIDDPMFVQSDKDGNMVISSRFDVREDKVALVSISLGEFVKALAPEEQVSWLDSEFYKNADIIVKRNLKATRAELPRLKVFVAN